MFLRVLRGYKSQQLIEGFVMKKIAFIFGMAVASAFTLTAQTADSVDVTFYYKTQDNPANVFLPGEFNGWGPNASGVISPGAISKMTKDTSTGIWWKTVQLRSVEASVEESQEHTNTRSTRTEPRQGGFLTR